MKLGKRADVRDQACVLSPGRAVRTKGKVPEEDALLGKQPPETADSKDPGTLRILEPK